MRLLLLFGFFLSAAITTFAEETPSDTIRVGYTRAAPFVIDEKEDLDGISIWLWGKIANSLNLEYEYIRMPFDQILAGLEDGSIDASINPLTITSERSRKMCFTYSFFASNSTIVVRKGSSLERARLFIQSTVSINFLRGMLALIIIIALFGIITWLFERKNNPTQFRPGVMGLWDGLWWSAVTMTTVGYGDKSPKSTGGKIIALIWMFTAILFISGFTASIASSLTVNQMSSNPQSIEDFKTRTVGTLKASGTMEYLKTHLFKNIQQYDGLQEGLIALKNKEIEAFLYDEPILKYRLSTEELYQGLEILPIKFDLQFYAFGFSKQRLDLKEQVSQKVLENLESIDWKYLISEYNLSQF